MGLLLSSIQLRCLSLRRQTTACSHHEYLVSLQELIPRVATANAQKWGTAKNFPYFTLHHLALRPNSKGQMSYFVIQPQLLFLHGSKTSSRVFGFGHYSGFWPPPALYLFALA